MDAALKTKILSVSSYVMAAANGALGVFTAKQGYPHVERLGDGGGVMMLYVGMPLVMLVLFAIAPVLLRKKGRIGLAFALGGTGVLFYALWLYAPYTVGVVGL